MGLLGEIAGRRVVLVAGKGGVGRTTGVAALALAAARLGRRALLVEVKEPSMPSASPLARLFGMDHLPHHPRRIAEGLEGGLLISEMGTELFLRSVLPIGAMASLAMRTPALLRLLHAGPSFFELGLFYHLLHFVRALDHDGRPRHEAIFFDMPATGHALALTQLPDLLLRIIPGGPIAENLRAGQAVMYDPASAAAVVVTLAEALPVSESLELIEALRRHRVPIGAVVANRVPRDPFTPEERAALEGMLAGGRRVRGVSELERRRRAEQSLARLRRETNAPLLRVDEVAEAAPREVVDAIVERLLAEEGVAAVAGPARAGAGAAAATTKAASPGAGGGASAGAAAPLEARP
jgi:anion-transporting  ArsA/GET3 family ATPase